MQNQLDNRVYAGFFVRLVAYLIDSVLAVLAVSVVKLPLTFMSLAGVDALKANFLFQHSVLDVVSYIGVVAYFTLLTYYTHSTPGKILMRLEVVTTKEEWTFLNILYRESIGRFLSSLLCIGYIAVAVQDKKQGFHDMLCDTYVVYRDMICCEGKTQGNQVTTQPVDGNEVESGEPFHAEEETGSTMEPIRSAFQLSESHPIDTGAVVSVNQEPGETGSVETKPENTYDGLNPDSSNLYQDEGRTE